MTRILRLADNPGETIGGMIAMIAWSLILFGVPV